MIYCIGDSHSSVFTGKGSRGKDYMTPIWPQRGDNTNPNFRAYNIGPATAYQLSNKENLISDLLTSEATVASKVLFCFGEVDIRAHLIKQSHAQKRPVEGIVKECVDRYSRTLSDFHKKGYSVWAWGPIASNPEELPYKGLEGAGPIYGDCARRNSVTKIFNDMLEQNCKERDLGFVSIFDDMVLPNGNTKEELIMDHIHLSQEAMPLIIEEFTKKGLL